MPKILATADLHGQLPEIPDCDALLIVGDICPDFGKRGPLLYPGDLETNGLQQAEWLDTVFREWLDELVSRGIKVIATWGNHDFVGEKPHLYQDLELPWYLLVDREARPVIGGRQLRIWGTPWVPNLPFWAFHGTDQSLALRASGISRDLDILMSHGPPYGSGDVVGPKYGGPFSVGEKPLANELARLSPKVLLCGHIHEASGVYHRDETTVMNVAYVDENYKPNLPPVELTQFKD